MSAVIVPYFHAEEYRVRGRLSLLAPPTLPPFPGRPEYDDSMSCIHARLQYKRVREDIVEGWKAFFRVNLRDLVASTAPEDVAKHVDEDEIGAVLSAGGRPALYALFFGPPKDWRCFYVLTEWDKFEKDIRERGAVIAVTGEDLLFR